MPDPVNTVLPVISGNAVVGQTLTVDEGTWTNDPTIFDYQWLRRPAPYSGSFTAISGAINNSYRLQSGDEAYEVTVDVTANNDVPVPTPGTPWLGWTVPAVPGGATVISTAADLLAALASPSDDAVYDATGLSHTFSDVLVTGRCSDGHPATFFFAPTVIFAGGSLLTGAAVEFKGAQNLVLYGGTVTNPSKGYGIIARGESGTLVACKNVTWWDFYIHDVAMTGLFVHQNTGDVDNIDFRGEITKWCRVPALDPHNTKGSGLHAAYLGVTSSTKNVKNSIFVLHHHDCEYGGGIQLGPRLQTVEAQGQGERLTYDPPAGADGTGGNIIQIFGDSQSNLVVSYVVGDSVRRGVEVSGLGTPANQIQVTYGRVTNSRQSAYDTSKPSAIAYTDCS